MNNRQINNGHPVIEKLRQLQSVEKWWLCSYSLGIFFSFSLAVLLVACLSDFYLRSENLLLRTFQTGLFSAVAVYGVIKFLAPGFRFKRNIVDVAKAIESRNPEFGRHLSLAADFLSTTKINGSNRLREQVIRKAEHQLKGLSLADQIQKTWPLRAIYLLTSIIVLGALFLSVHPVESMIALKRTVSPFTASPWPALNDLAFEDLPQKIATGDDIACRVIDRNHRLPEKIVLEIDNGNGIRIREMVQKQSSSILQIPNISQTIKIRASGGDDQTEWHMIEVKQPPEIKSLKIDVVPPEYSGLSRHTVPLFQKVWSGSKIRLLGNTSTPFQAGRIIFLTGKSIHDLQRSKSTGLVFPGNSLLTLDQEEKFRIELVNEENLVGGRKRNFRIPVRADEPPIAEIKNLATRDLYSPKDLLTVQLLSSDDMQLKSGKLVLTVDGQNFRSIDIQVPSLSPQRASSTKRSVFEKKMDIPLSQIEVAGPGSAIELELNVQDSQGKITRSNKVIARIGSESDLKNLDAHSRNKIFELLSKALAQQQNAINLNALLHETSTQVPPGSGLGNRLRPLWESQQKVELILFGPDGVIDQCGNYLASKFETRTERYQVKKSEIDAVSRQVILLKNSARFASDQANEAFSFADDLKLALDFLDKSLPHQTRIVTSLAQLVGSIDKQTKHQAYLAALKNIVGREKDALGGIISCQNRSFQAGSSKSMEVEINRLIIEQKGIAAKLKEIGWGLLNDSSELESNNLKRLGEKVTLAEIDAKSASTQLTKRQFGLATQSIEKVINVLSMEIGHNKLSSLLGVPTKSEIRDAQNDFQPIVEQHGQLLVPIRNWTSLSDKERNQLLKSLLDLQARLIQFKASNQNALSDASRRRVTDINRLIDEIKSNLGNGKLESANSKMNEVRSNLAMITAELENSFHEADMLERNERFRRLQVDFADWLDLQSSIKSTLESTKPQDYSLAANKISVSQKDLTDKIVDCANSNSDLYALHLELEKLEKQSQGVESALQEMAVSKAIDLCQVVITTIKNLSDEKAGGHPPENKPEKSGDDSHNGDGPENEFIQISEFEIRLIRIMQEEILAETKRIEKIQSQTLEPAQRAKITKATLSLADRQSELISTLQKYMVPKTGDKKPTVPDIPSLDNIPELPEIECGASDQERKSSSGQSTGKGLNKSKHGNQETKSPDSPKKQRQEKQGEDIGEQSNSVGNRLKQIREKMKSVQELLVEQKLSKENQAIQNAIIKDLNLFATDQRQQSQKSPQNPNGEKQLTQGDSAAINSNPNQDPDSKAKGQLNLENANIQKRIDQIWGHLPERIRRKELNIRAEQFLPKYRELIKEYFKRLAKEPTIQ